MRRTTDTLAEAAKKLRDLDVGALPICGDDDRLHGESVADLVEAISSAPSSD